MPDAIWIDKDDELPALAQTLESQPSIGVDTEFLRERTFFPKLCLLQLAARRPNLVRRHAAHRQPRPADARPDGARPRAR